MKILITNDDGINSEGLFRVAKWARKLGEITVCAPKVEQSGKSHSIDIHNPFEVKQVELLQGVRAFSVDSSPADCVRFATLGLHETYDLVISGVNKGLNLGEDIMYSATNGAIFEACTRGLKAIALSTHTQGFADAEAWFDRVFDFVNGNNLFAYGNIFNVNIPKDAKSIRLTRQGGAYFTDDFIDLGNGTWRQEGHCIHQNNHDLTIDSDATVDGYVSITPLTISRTDYTAYTALKSLLPDNQTH